MLHMRVHTCVSRESLLAVAASFAGNHAVKRHAATALHTPSDFSNDQRLAFHRIFCDAFISEASESGLQVKALSSVLSSLH